MVAQGPFQGLSTLEIVLVVMGFVFIGIGIAYFVCAYTFGNQEDPAKGETETKPSSRQSSAGRSACPTPGMVPSQKYSLAIPSVLDAPHEHSKKSDYEIKDANGNKLLNVEVMRPFQDDDTDIGAPHEYVSLHSKDGEEELAMCALAPTGGGKWECNVYQGEGTEGSSQLYGSLVREPSSSMGGDVQFALISPRGERLLVIRGRVQERRMEVLDHNGAVTAIVEPGTTWGFSSSSFYQAQCLIDADVGLIVLSLLAVDRLLSHTGK